MGGIEARQAKEIIESLRYGTPPRGHVREFTVGRQKELEQLEDSITGDIAQGGALLVRANYGGGKSHLLQIVRERALEAGYAVALVVTDAAGGVRFNRMDTILGAVSRAIEVPGSALGIRTLFERFRRGYREVGSTDRLMKELSADGRWSQKGQLCDPVLIGLRAWVLGDEAQRSMVEEWFSWPEPYRGRRRDLYWNLIADVQHRFDDPRSDSRYYADHALAFHNDGHANAWDSLGDLHAVAVACGLRGLILLFDEFEDVVQNLRNRSYEIAAFKNLFDFFGGESYPGKAYFAVTPDFAKACRDELHSRGVYGFPMTSFSKLPAFELASLSDEDFVELALRIAAVHGIAFGWKSQSFADGADWEGRVRATWGRPTPDRIRIATQGIVGVLDAAFKGQRGAIR